MIGKKAFEIQFNWIFVLVAGALILLFFAGIIVKQKSVTEVTSQNSLLKSIDAIITGASVTTDTTKIERIQSINLQVECNRVSVGRVSKQYQNLILFAPGTIKGDNPVWQTIAFNEPYKVTNFLYMTSPQVRYIILGNDPILNYINKTLPASISKEYPDIIPLTIANKNNYKVRFVFGRSTNPIDNYLTNFQQIPDEDVTAIKIISGDLEKGEVEFFEKGKNLKWVSKGKSPYLAKSSLIGSVYSDSKELYDCSMKNAFSRFGLVTKTYTERTNNLKNDLFLTRPDCRTTYENSIALLNKEEMKKPKLDAFEMGKTSIAAKSISDLNQEAKRLSCPLIY